MEMLSYFLLALLGSFALAILINAQDQTGFISLDCGLQENSSYSELTTGINYTSDAQYIDTGIRQKVLPQYNLKKQSQMDNVRSFPEGDKNCYNLNLSKGDRYLIRASFMYGNYDTKNEIPKFDLYLGPNLWRTVSLPDASTSNTFEIIHTLQSNHLYVCLVNTGNGTPFISALELRPLKKTAYESQTGWLECFRRDDVGSTAEDGFRFKEDVYDRYWVPLERNDWTQKRTEIFIDSGNDNDYQPPSLAMRTAAAPDDDGESLDFTLGPMDSDAKLYVYMHFAEVEELESEGPRRLIVSYNDSQIETFSLEYLKATTKFFKFELNGGQEGSLSIDSAEDSTLPPILNAIEIYMEKQFSKLQTAEQDVDAILNIKSIYGLKRNWQGDPCAPPAFLWEGLNCSNNDPPRIISLNLSSSGLTGEIPPYIANFIELQYLGLSNNRLTGSVPEFLSQLQSLKVLNLKANMLKGSVPAKLIEMSEKGLQLSVEGNPDLGSPMSFKKKSIKIVVAVVISPSLLVLIIGLGIIWRLKRRKVTAGGARNYHSLGPRNLHVTYSEVRKITNNFERILGKGGFGTVFHGYLGDTQVAVKMLSHSSDQGYKQFEAEVALLLRVHHRNLISLIGYCDEGNNLGLIYEYMAKGNLAELLSESSIDILSWEQRLQIVVDAASGLEYLHNGCKQPIIHRDVKSSNILLSENFQAKIADFGMSKPLSMEGGSDTSTVVIGTPGYLDPECCENERLTEKSDVYSFGVVLLVVITSRPVISKTIEKTHISEWVRFMLSKGDVKSIVDPRLNEDFDPNSAWRAVEVAMACVSPSSAERPAMKNVVAELCDCLATVKARKNVGHENESENFVGMGTVVLNSIIEMGPLVR